MSTVHFDLLTQKNAVLHFQLVTLESMAPFVLDSSVRMMSFLPLDQLILPR